jgi:DNA topoisomerase-3
VLAFREPDGPERAALERVVAALRQRDGQTTGRLHREVFGEALERRAFERLLAGLVRARVLREVPDEFETQGEIVAFRRAFLADPTCLANVRLTLEPETFKAPSRRRAGQREPRARASRRARSSTAGTTAAASIVDALKAWRLEESRRRRVPAFRILSDRVLLAIASGRPRDEDALLRIPGIGPRLLQKYGAKLLEIVSR